MMFRDIGRYREISGDIWRYMMFRYIMRTIGKYREIAGDIGRYREISGEAV